MTVAIDPAQVVVIDQLDSRVLGAVRFVDATTGRWITSPLAISAPRMTLVRNRSGAYVVTAAAGLEDHVTAFTAPPGAPPLQDLTTAIGVVDPTGRYLARTFRLSLPRDPDPGHSADPSSLFRAALVALYPAPAAPLYPGWAILRVSVKRGATEQGVANAWLRVRRASQGTEINPPLAAGMTDARGEALVAVSGVPITNWDVEDGPVLATEIDAVLEAYFDADADSPPDPDVIDGRRATLPTVAQELMLASGRQSAVRLQLTIP